MCENLWDFYCGVVISPIPCDQPSTNTQIHLPTHSNAQGLPREENRALHDSLQKPRRAPWQRQDAKKGGLKCGG